VAKGRSWGIPLALVGLALLLVAAAAAAYLFVFRGGPETSSEPVDAATAQASTVMLVTIDDGRVASHSSGQQSGQPAQVSFVTEQVASHPYLDLAVLRIESNAEETGEGYMMSSELEGEVGLPTLGIGDSSAAAPGDEVYVTGFPLSPNITSTDKGLLELPTSTSATGSVDNSRMWPGCENSDWQVVIPTEQAVGANCADSGNVERAILSAEMPNGTTGPGSPLIRDGQVVGVVLGPDREDPTIVHSISSEAFEEWLTEVVADNG